MYTPEIRDEALLLEGLHKSYGAIVALDGLTLRIPRGEIYGLLGPNGAGKTTALRIICGLLAADSGNSHSLGHTLGVTPPELGYMPQRGGLYDDLSIEENLRFFARAYGLAHQKLKVGVALEQYGLAERANQPVATLSGGWRQRVALAVTLLHAPQLLLLDEPTAGLDSQARESLWLRLRTLAAEGVTILVTTHYADEAQRCDRVGYLHQGRLRIEGPPDLLTQKLGLSVWRVGAGTAPPSGPMLHAVRDATGWRVLTSATLPSAALAEWCVQTDTIAVPEPPRLADALSWLAAGKGTQS